MAFTFDELSGKVIAAAIEVHKQLGPGFIETVYEQALRIELTKQDINFEFQKKIEVHYDGQLVGVHILDLLVDGQIVVELKAMTAFEDSHFAQLRSYLRASGVKIGLLLNFGTKTLAVKRIVD